MMLDDLEGSQEGQQVESEAPQADAGQGSAPEGTAADNGGVNQSPVQEQPPSGGGQPPSPVSMNSTQPTGNSFSMADMKSINYEMLVDVPLKVTVELGRSEMTVQDILNLEKGSVIELNRIAGDPVDVFVNDYLIAKGEVVVVDDNFGVRITKIVASPSVLGKN